MPQRFMIVGLGLALLSALTFATSGSFARSLLAAGWSAEAAVTARVGVAAVVLAIPAVWSLRGRWLVLRRNWRAIVGFGLFGVVCAQACFFNAVNYLPIGIALLLEYLGILFVVGWMWARHGQRPRRYAIAGSVAAVLGLVLVLDPTADGGSLDPVGVLWGLGAAVGLACYFVISARSDSALPPVALAGGGMIIGTAALGLLGVVGALPMHATFGEVEFAGQVVELARTGGRRVAGGGGRRVPHRHRRRPGPRRPRRLLRRADRGDVRRTDRLGGVQRTAHRGAAGRRRVHRHGSRPGPPRRVAPAATDPPAGAARGRVDPG